MDNKYLNTFSLELYEKAIDLVSNTLQFEKDKIGIYYYEVLNKSKTKHLAGWRATEDVRHWYNPYWVNNAHPPLSLLLPMELLNESSTLEKNFIESLLFSLNTIINDLSVKNDNLSEELSASLLYRLTFPHYLRTQFQFKHANIKNLITNPDILDFGRLIREVFHWKNNTIEGKEINTGFIITDTIDLFEESIPKAKVVKLYSESPISLFDFSSVKGLLEIADGKRLFLLVKNGPNMEVQGICIFEEDFITELTKKSIGFIAPIFSIKETGLIISRGKQIILEHIKGRPFIRQKNNERFTEVLHNQIKKINKKATKIQVEKLSKIIIELSKYGKGASLIFGFDEMDYNHTNSVDYKIRLCEKLPLYKGDSIEKSKEAIMKLLSDVSKTDGAVLVNSQMEIIGLGAILRSTNVPGSMLGGSRHKSMGSYTANKSNLFGIVISSDGPISLVHNNKCICKL